MTRTPAAIPRQGTPVETLPVLTAQDLGEIVAQFNDATSKLSSAHDALRAEVKRLETELHESRRQLRRAEQLAALGELAAGIAHEVRNPLGSIKLYARVLVEDLADRPAARETADKIALAVDRLNGVVGDVLAFSRDLQPACHACEATDLIDQVFEACAGTAAEMGVELTSALPENHALRCDAGLLAQALVNVVRNACEAAAEAPPGARRVRVHLEARGELDASGRRREMSVFVVRDSGTGVPADVLPRLFNPFFTTRAAGTGLGLSIVHRILDAHGGGVVIRNACDARAPRRRRAEPRHAGALDGLYPGAIVELLIPGAPAPAASPSATLSEVEAA